MNQKLTQAVRVLSLLTIAVFGVFSILATGGGGGGGSGGGTGGSGGTAPAYRQYDCAADKIGITATSRETSQTGGQFSQHITITVTCDGNPADDADVKIKLWYGDPIKRTTANTGMTSWRNRVHATGTGSNYKLTVIGTDADGNPESVSKSFTFNQ